MAKKKGEAAKARPAEAGPKPETKQAERAVWWQPALMVFARLSGWIVAPVVLAVFLGKWLDRKYSTEPWLFLATVGFSFFISIFGLAKNAVEEFKKIEEEEKKNAARKTKEENNDSSGKYN